jgi:hypothetical protein
MLVAVGLGAGLVVYGRAGNGSTATAASAKVRPVVCGRHGRPPGRPAALPQAFPLPSGTAITKVASSHQKGLPPVVTIQGFAPLSLSDAALFFLRQLPVKGFQMLRSESEPGSEAEGRFLGNGTSGAWKVRDVRCANGVAFLVGFVLAA